MQPETEQILGTIEVIVAPSLRFYLPGYEDGGDIVPFVWDASELGEFNVLNLSRVKGWLRLTDPDFIFKKWQEMEYLKNFPDFSLNSQELFERENKIKALSQLLSANLEDLEAFIISSSSYATLDSLGFVIGRTKDGDWICSYHTVYKETEISQDQISRSPLIQPTSTQPLGEDTRLLNSRIRAIISDLGTIHLEGDGGCGYCYTYEHRFVFASATTKKLAIEEVLQTSGMIEICLFHGFCSDAESLKEWYNTEQEENYEIYKKLNKFLTNNFSTLIMYRFSFWTQEHIYIIGQIHPGDWVGLYLESEFIYNP